ncbi:hypothetical protein ABGF49_07730 [Helcococcus ovis]|uniref:hypothetical protein n=1 Tax=Helcococcus TaxID=31983 RepID=UPI0038BDD967
MIRKIKEVIKELIDPISELAFDVMPEKKIYPHVVATFVTDYYSQGLHTITLDIDVWDKNTLSKNVDEIAEEIEDKLNRFYFTDEYIHFSVWHISTGTIENEDKTLRRKTCIFQIHARKGK